MDIEILQDKKNPLLGRREVKFKASFQGPTPKRQEARGKIVAILNSDRELTVLDRLDTDFGAQTAQGYVKVYDDRKAMAIEPAYKLKRNFPEEKKAEEKPAEEAKPKEEGK
jgi:small subunit ribosomal protein S24e